MHLMALVITPGVDIRQPESDQRARPNVETLDSIHMMMGHKDGRKDDGPS